jgi:hypothetical protein
VPAPGFDLLDATTLSDGTVHLVYRVGERLQAEA